MTIAGVSQDPFSRSRDHPHIFTFTAANQGAGYHVRVSAY